MSEYPNDIFTEVEDRDVHTLQNLGPLAPMAGIWEGAKGFDVNPNPGEESHQAFIERYELQPIDSQANGPQYYYGLRYHIHIVKPGEVETFHDQVGYWLWEPRTGTIVQTLSLPRGQTAMAIGHAAPDATSFELTAARGSTVNGICSNPFLEENFRTMEYRVKVTINANGTWEYELVTILEVRGQAEPFRHTDHNVLTKVGEPTPNPLALADASTAATA
jgi:hypothetical protein